MFQYVACTHYFSIPEVKSVVRGEYGSCCAKPCTWDGSIGNSMKYFMGKSGGFIIPNDLNVKKETLPTFQAVW